MTTSSSSPHQGDTTTRGRDRHDRSRLRAGARVGLTVVAAGAIIAGAFVAMGTSNGGAAPGTEPRLGNQLVADWSARGEGQSVLGGSREPGTTSIQRQPHDNVVFTVTIAPARPGRNLVRVDVTKTTGGPHNHANRPIYVGSLNDDKRNAMQLAEVRPGTDGRWAVVDLPEGSGTVLVTHGRWHRIPFAVDTGTVDQAGGSAAVEAGADMWSGADGPECVSVSVASTLANGKPVAACPSDQLTDEDRSSLVDAVDFLIGRGVGEIAVESDESTRSTEALAAVQQAAASAGIPVVAPSQAPGERSALLVISGWDDAASSLAAVTRLPLEQQQVRSDGVWLAPWLLTPGVVDSTAGAVLPLDFDIRAGEAQRYSQALAQLLPGQAPTASGFAAWRALHDERPGRTTLYAASRAAFMPAMAGHESHETEVSWFPGGTVTPVASLQ